MTFYADYKFLVTVTTVEEAATPAGLGAIALLVPAGTTPIPNGYTIVTSLADVIGLLVGNQITADAEEMAIRVFGQGVAVGDVYVATYDDATEDPSDAAATLEAAGVDVQILVPCTRADADLAALGAWLSIDSRPTRYVVIAESANAALLTGTPPPALNNARQRNFRLLYSAASDLGLAGAQAAALRGSSLAGGPVIAEVQVLGVEPSDSLTAAEIAFLRLNNVGVLQRFAPGSGFGTLIISGRNTYNGTSYKSLITVLYAVRLVVLAVQALVLQRSVPGGRGIAADPRGAAAVEGAADVPLAGMAAAGHFLPGIIDGVAYPAGYTVNAAVSADDIALQIVYRTSQEVDQILINNINRVA